MKNITNKTKKHFNETAKDYNNSFDGKYVKPMYEYILGYFKDKKEEAAILDIGCGNGNILAELVTPKNKLYGIDLSENMIMVARKRLHGNAELQIADAKELPFQDNQFDYIICNASFHHYPYPLETLMEMNRVLKKGGVLLIGEGYAYEPFRFILNIYFKFASTGDFHSYGQHELTRMLQKTGFHVEKVKRSDMRIFYEARARKDELYENWEN